MAAASIGLGPGALDAAITYAKKRKAFGNAIASNQSLKCRADWQPALLI